MGVAPVGRSGRAEAFPDVRTLLRTQKDRPEAGLSVADRAGDQAALKALRRR
jgi:hypothetical protein